MRACVRVCVCVFVNERQKKSKEQNDIIKYDYHG